MCAAAASRLMSLSVPVSYLAASPMRVFYPVGGPTSERLEVITEIFNRILRPLYGPQEKAIGQIAEGKDRACYLLYEDETPVGVLVFKTQLSNEFAEYGVEDSIEIKSLFVDHSAKNSGKGLGSSLVDKLKEEVRNLALGQKNIHVTVSETKGESLQFFQKKGFRIAYSWKGRYLPEVTEHLLACSSFMEEDSAPSVRLRPGASLDAEVPELTAIIHNAHVDDVHTLTRLSDGSFISGSKDNCLYKWSSEGVRLRIVDEVEPTQQDERDWVTAVTPLTSAYWVSGQRNGAISLWKTNGEYVKEFCPKLPKLGGHISAPENARRVACLAGGLDGSQPSFFVGFPTMFSEFSLIEGRTVSATRVHANDWVYCIHPLTEQRVLLAVGGSLDVWSKGESLSWARSERVIEEAKAITVPSSPGVSRRQRVFISKILPLEGSSQFALALFNGQIQIVDLVDKRATQVKAGHKGRIWTLEKVGAHEFLSSAEDGTVRLWDTRRAASVRTLCEKVETMAMLSLGGSRVVLGTGGESIPENKGQLRFYDLRMTRA